MSKKNLANVTNCLVLKAFHPGKDKLSSAVMDFFELMYEITGNETYPTNAAEHVALHGIVIYWWHSSS